MAEKPENRAGGSEINQPHDKGYKYLFSSQKVFLELLQSFVKAGWVGGIEEKDLVRVDKSYILQDFSDKEADLVYKVKINDQEAIFYLLMEMQSTVDFQMPYRLLLYMTEIWRDILRDTPRKEARRKDFRLPAVVPIVLYNGKNNWTACRSYRETLKAYEIFAEYVLDFKYILIDVNRYRKEELLELSNLIGAIFLLDQKADPEELLGRIDELLDMASKLDANQFRLFRTWILKIATKDLNEDEKHKVIQSLDETHPEEVKQLISNFAQNIKTMQKEAIKKGKQEGRQEGRQVGRQEGEIKGKLEVARKMLMKGMSIAEVADITGLTREQIQKTD